MLFRITNLRTPVELPEQSLPAEIARRLELPPEELSTLKILRKSLDARNRHRMEFVYSLTVSLPDADSMPFADGMDIAAWTPPAFEEPEPGTQPLPDRPVIIGSGPAGLLAGYVLALHGYRPIIIERGQAVRERVPAIRKFDSGGEHDVENNYLFGEGGAGCFSDGKLTCRSRARTWTGCCGVSWIAADDRRWCTSIVRIWAATNCH
jgi:uncharacterized FAD-dependent dehydrogenase